MRAKKMLGFTLVLAILLSVSACETQKRGRGKTPPGKEKKDDDNRRGRRF